MARTKLTIFLVVLFSGLVIGIIPASAHTANRATNLVFAKCADFGNDIDGDSICDGWENADAANPDRNMIITWRPSGWTSDWEYRCGVDDSGYDPVCPKKGVRDILVEVDCIAGQCPSVDAITKVKNAFSEQGIELHVQYSTTGDIKMGEAALVDSDHNSSPATGTRFPGTDSAPGFDQIKSKHFGTLDERGVAGSPAETDWLNYKWKQKQQVFHYVLFAKYQTGNTGSSGIAELGGNDLMISLGSFSGGVGSVEQQAGTFMHELGHNLNFNHGGADNINCKPNYLSVMHYARQMGDLVPTRDVDYSRKAMGPMDGAVPAPNELSENSLSEDAGVETYADVGMTTALDNDASAEEQYTYGPGTPAALVWTGGPTDWNRTPPTGGTVSVNINDLSGCNGATMGEILKGSLDWNRIDFLFRDDSDAADGVQATDPVSGTSCDQVTFPEELSCIRELSGGAVNGDIPPIGTDFDITDGNQTMKINMTDNEITLEIVLDHRQLRFDTLKDKVVSLAGDVEDKTVGVKYEKAFDSENPTDNENFYKTIRLLNKIENTMDESSGGNAIDDLIPFARQNELLPGLESVKLTFRIAANFEPNDYHKAKFTDGSPRQQEFLGTPSDQVQCKAGFKLTQNGQDDRPACILSDHLIDFNKRAWVTGLVDLTHFGS